MMMMMISKTMFMVLSSCRAIVRVHPLHLMNVERRQAAADPNDLGCEFACRLPESTPTIAIYYYYSARKLILMVIMQMMVLYRELEDLERSHAYLTDLVERMSIPVFTDVHKALECTKRVLEMVCCRRSLFAPPQPHSQLGSLGGSGPSTKGLSPTPKPTLPCIFHGI